MLPICQSAVSVSGLFNKTRQQLRRSDRSAFRVRSEEKKKRNWSTKAAFATSDMEQPWAGGDLTCGSCKNDHPLKEARVDILKLQACLLILGSWSHGTRQTRCIDTRLASCDHGRIKRMMYYFNDVAWEILFTVLVLLTKMVERLHNAFWWKRLMGILHHKTI